MIFKDLLPEEYLHHLIDMVSGFAPRLVTAILVYLLGIYIIRRVAKVLTRVLTARSYDPTLQNFLQSLIRIGLLVMLVITVIGILGVNTTSFAALLAGAGLAIGGALNGSLGNLAGGVMLLVFRPFQQGDLIEAHGTVGTVKDLGIFNTTLVTADHKLVLLPNGMLSTGKITNYTASGKLRVDLVLSFHPRESLSEIRRICLEVLQQHEQVLENPEPKVQLLSLDASSMKVAVWPYCHQPHYWNVYFHILEQLKTEFEKAEIRFAPVTEKQA
ncbi:MAG TPA: mechanosensitive ion channel domain-containing protein [Saprospiraceae bacterium]|nr:mechanosensitive ion channel domain-containing protein [Saprospiraceae bacterium]